MLFRSSFLFIFLTLAINQALADGFYSVRAVPIDERNSDLVAAKHMGINKAKRIALETLLERMASQADEIVLPSEREIESMVARSQIRDEVYGGDRYLALLDVEFQPKPVQQFLRRHRITFLETFAAPVRIIPVTRLLGVDLPPAEENPAWDVWQGLLSTQEEQFHFVPIELAGREFYRAWGKRSLQDWSHSEGFSAQQDFVGNYVQRIEFFSALPVSTERESVKIRLSFSSLKDDSLWAVTRLELPVSEQQVDWQPILQWTQGILDQHWRERILAQIGDTQVITTLPMILYSSDHAEIIDILGRLSNLRAVHEMTHESITPRLRTFRLSYRGSEANFLQQLTAAGLSLRDAPKSEIMNDNHPSRILLEKK